MPDLPPIYTSALFADRILIERDDRVMSAIRLVDIHLVNPRSVLSVTGEKIQAGSESPTALIENNLLVLFKSEAACDFTATISVWTPDGKQLIKQDYPVHVGAGVNGHAIKMEVRLAINIGGVFWFDVEINGRVVHRVPLEVRFQPATHSESQTQTPSPSADPSA